jgi:hypothetical protein
MQTHLSLFCKGIPYLVIPESLSVRVNTKLVVSLAYNRRKIRLIEDNAKCRHLIDLSTLRQVFICLKPPPLLGFCWGGVEIL